MVRKNRLVPDRQKSLLSVRPTGHITLAGARMMYEGIGGKAICCTINEYCRTQIFDFPRIDFRSNCQPPSHTIYESSSIQANIVSNLCTFFSDEMYSKHYAISPSLREMVQETYEKKKSQQNGKPPFFVVIQECNKLVPVELKKGECSIVDEICKKDGEAVPMLIGGREGKKFITAWHTSDGQWPQLPNNQQLINTIMAGIRVGQDTADPIKKHVDQNCLVTDDGRFVVTMRPTMSARVGTATVMDTKAYKDKACQIREAISAIEQDISIAHIALLVNSMYREDYNDDAYQRLHYLRLWESLAEAGQKYLDYCGNVRTDDVVISGKKTLRELKGYRDDIAHWWTDTIDENFLAELQRTLNELIRRKYFG